MFVSFLYCSVACRESVAAVAVGAVAATRPPLLRLRPALAGVFDGSAHNANILCRRLASGPTGREVSKLGPVSCPWGLLGALRRGGATLRRRCDVPESSGRRKKRELVWLSVSERGLSKLNCRIFGEEYNSDSYVCSRVPTQCVNRRQKWMKVLCHEIKILSKSG